MEQEKKEEKREENREENKGLLHIYCGDGKGKTTAAIGLAVRAAGSGMNVLFARFLKNENSGELKILDAIPRIEVLRPEKSFGFYQTLDEEERRELHRVYGELWKTVMEKAGAGSYDMLVLDEFAAAYRYGLFDREDALRFLKERPSRLEAVLTGRDPAAELLLIADYVSDIRKEKHPFDRGMMARKGIEF
ncbi:MAG: cob(I)yrinic acid a,c-diamide adenosyltransferase [Coprococcus sp.]|nr:cob(I)yrinic acid a,c-diamide adenosyltransferase [Coprococcus sp.]